MTTKNMTNRIEQLWKEWLATSERLQGLLHEQTVALTMRDTTRLEKLQPAIDTVVAKLGTVDSEAVAMGKKLAEELGCEPSLRGLTQALEKADAQRLQQIANRVIVAERQASHVMKKNRSLIENELEHIGGTLALIAREASIPTNPYPRPSTATHAVVMNAVA